MDDGRTGTRFDPREIHDFWPRLLASPILGALVVNLSGLIDHARHSTGGLVAAYAWFAMVAFVVWEGNRRLYFRLPRREDWLLRPWSRLGVLLAVITPLHDPGCGHASLDLARGDRRRRDAPVRARHGALCRRRLRRRHYPRL